MCASLLEQIWNKLKTEFYRNRVKFRYGHYCDPTGERLAFYLVDETTLEEFSGAVIMTLKSLGIELEIGRDDLKGDVIRLKYKQLIILTVVNYSCVYSAYKCYIIIETGFDQRDGQKILF